MSVTIEFLWKDRKRYFGLPLSFTRYCLSEDRLFISEGFLNIRDDEILLYRVRDVDTRRSLWQRLFGVVEEMKIRRRVRFGEIMTATDDDDLDDDV